MMNKPQLRQIYLDRQKSLSQAERTENSQQIAKQFFTNFSLEKLQNLHLFLSIEKNGEIETRFIYQSLWRDSPNICTFAPRVCGEELEHLKFNANTPLSVNNWKIAEPVGNDLVDENLFDAVIVPLLCFDARGYRVGYGKGFYDKFLSKCRKDCLKVGLSFFPPVGIFEINEFDVKLDYCLTPNLIYQF